jgi:hypothetical protein
VVLESEGNELLEQINRIEQTTDKKIETVTADRAYSNVENYSQLEQRNIEAAKDCRHCPIRYNCISSTAHGRMVEIRDGYESLVRARRRWLNRDEDIRDKYKRHKWRVEGSHGEAKTSHGLRRAVRRGLANVSIRVYLTAI